METTLKRKGRRPYVFAAILFLAGLVPGSGPLLASDNPLYTALAVGYILADELSEEFTAKWSHTASIHDVPRTREKIMAYIIEREGKEFEYYALLKQLDMHPRRLTKYLFELRNEGEIVFISRCLTKAALPATTFWKIYLSSNAPGEAELGPRRGPCHKR